MNIPYTTFQPMVDYVNQNTNRETMSDLTTRQIAAHFALDTTTAFQMLNELAKQKKITKLDPINGDNFSCCGWIANN